MRHIRLIMPHLAAGPLARHCLLYWLGVFHQIPFGP
jgi:hypothetical protein